MAYFKFKVATNNIVLIWTFVLEIQLDIKVLSFIAVKGGLTRF